MSRKRNRITPEMSNTIAESSPLIKKTKVIAGEDSQEHRILEINLKDLEANPHQPRININMQSLNELISSIEQNGLMQPIVVTDMKENGMHTIVAGHRRYEAFKIMGKPKIDALVKKGLTNQDLAILSLTENLMRENLHPIENAIAIKNILDNGIVESQNKLAEYVGLSKGYVSKLMSILKLPSNIISKIKEDSYTDINILILLNKLNDETEMLEALEAIKNLKRSEAEKYIKNNYLSHKPISKSLINIKSSKSKISVDIDTKELTQDQVSEIDEKIAALNKEVIELLASWDK